MKTNVRLEDSQLACVISTFTTYPISYIALMLLIQGASEAAPMPTEQKDTNHAWVSAWRGGSRVPWLLCVLCASNSVLMLDRVMVDSFA
jgi:hypothetical protein